MNNVLLENFKEGFLDPVVGHKNWTVY